MDDYEIRKIEALHPWLREVEYTYAPVNESHSLYRVIPYSNIKNVEFLPFEVDIED